MKDVSLEQRIGEKSIQEIETKRREA